MSSDTIAALFKRVLKFIMKILFVCLGNIVRSPLAETLFRVQAEQMGLGEKYIVDSAGTAAYHIGERPDHRMREVAHKHGVLHDGKGRQVINSDFNDFELIIAMDASNMANLKKLATSENQRERLKQMREYDPDANGQLEVPDPYYGGLDGFEAVYTMIERSTLELLRRLEAGENLKK
jgi:protein-tyrosine phosphatase